MENKKVDKSLRRKTKTLYIKSLAEISEERMLESTKEMKTEIKTWFPVGVLTGALAGVLTGALAGVGLSMLVDPRFSWIGVFLMVAAGITTTGVYKRQMKYDVRHHYKYTYTFSEKNYEFEKLMGEYTNSEKKFRVVFVLDEFDKIWNESTAQNMIYDIIHPLKMLINQGSGIVHFCDSSGHNG